MKATVWSELPLDTSLAVAESLRGGKSPEHCTLESHCALGGRRRYTLVEQRIRNSVLCVGACASGGPLFVGRLKA